MSKAHRIYHRLARRIDVSPSSLRELQQCLDATAKDIVETVARYHRLCASLEADRARDGMDVDDAMKETP